MMKKWASVSLFVLLLAASSWAETSKEEIYTPGTFFITHEQFMTLTPAEQLTYVKKIREVIVEMAETFPYFAEEMSARSGLFQQLWTLNIPTAHSDEATTPKAGYDFVAFSVAEANKYLEEIKAVDTSKLSEQEKKAVLDKYRQSMYWTSMAASKLGPLPKTKYKTQRNTLNSAIKKTATQIDDLEKKIISLAPTQDDSEFRTARDNYLKKALSGKLSSKASIPAVEYDVLVPPVTTVQKEVSPKDPESGKGTPPLPPEAAAPAGSAAVATSAERPLYRCLYAGFVIKKDPCIAPRTLPWDLKPLDQKTFICAQDTIMCNPLIFGLKTDCDRSTLPEKCLSGAKPHCVKPGRDATKSCAETSANTMSFQTTVDLIKANMTTFNEFGRSFQDLCYNDLIDFNSYPRKRTEKNMQRTRDDIKKTCKVAQKRISEIENQYNLTFPASETKKLKSKPSKAPQGKDLLMKKSNTGKQ